MKNTFLAIGALLALIPASFAGILVDPALVSGSNAIDPLSPDANAGALDASGIVNSAPSKAALTGTAGFQVVQDFTGFTGASGSSINYISFTNASVPDIRITSTSYNGSGGGASGNFTTSGTSSQFIGSGGYTADAAQTIEFGTWNGTTFSADKTVSAAGFMLTQNANAIARTWTVSFFDALDNQIGTSLTFDANASSAALFGNIQASNVIAKITLGITGGGDAGTFMDDFGFAVVPEPSTYAAVLGLFSLGLILRRRRR